MWRSLHSALALGSLLLVLIITLSGVFLASVPVTDALSPAVQAPGALSVAEVLGAIGSSFDEPDRLERLPSGAVVLTAIGPDGPERHFIDIRSGASLGLQHDDPLVMWVRELHRSFLLGRYRPARRRGHRAGDGDPLRHRLCAAAAPPGRLARPAGADPRPALRAPACRLGPAEPVAAAVHGDHRLLSDAGDLRRAPQRPGDAAGHSRKPRRARPGAARRSARAEGHPLRGRQDHRLSDPRRLVRRVLGDHRRGPHLHRPVHRRCAVERAAAPGAARPRMDEGAAYRRRHRAAGGGARRQRAERAGVRLFRRRHLARRGAAAPAGGAAMSRPAWPIS